MKKQKKSKSVPKMLSTEEKSSSLDVVQKDGLPVDTLPSVSPSVKEGTSASSIITDQIAAKPDIQLAPQLHPLLASLPAYLKNPANVDDIMKRIGQTMATTCTHSDIEEMSKCKKCTDKMLERRRYLKNLGFKSPAQYKAWQAVHGKIREMYPLVDFRTGKANIHKSL